MNAAISSTARWGGHWLSGWNRFWFTPAQPHTLALIRLLGGSMLFYTHLVWTLDLEAFFGPHSWITSDVSRTMQGPASYSFSYFWFVESTTLLWTLHIAALVVFAMFAAGLFTRVTSVLAFLLTLMYCHRQNGALFGLDQVNAMLAMYLMIGPSGAVYSLDRLIARIRAGGPLPPPAPSVAANVAVRLIQLHMCVIYLFGGVGKIKGQMWWVGNAFWLSIANLEYQSLDVTWLVHFPFVIALLTHVTVLWETFYCFIVWPRATRPICLALAVAVHGGIALCLGMITFGLAMIIGNVAFVPPEMVRAAVGKVSRLWGRAGQGGAAEEAIEAVVLPPTKRVRRPESISAV